VKAQNETREADLKSGAQGDPLVQAVLARFPGAVVEKVTPASEIDAAPDGDIPESESE
jgi:hypothetical protein